MRYAPRHIATLASFAFAACAALANVPSTATAATIGTGSTAQIGRGASGYPCTATRAKFEALQAGLLTHRHAATMRAMEDGIFLERGERVRVVRRVGGTLPALELRIQSGSDAGKSCWMDADVDEALVNVRPAR